MAKRRDVLADQLRQLADDLEELWKALTRDPNVEQRKQRAWTVVVGIVGAAATMASRRALAKLWPILTGERPPAGTSSAPQPLNRPQEERLSTAR